MISTVSSGHTLTRLEHSLRATDGIELHAACWMPEGAPQAVVVMVHGMTEHSGRYFRLAEALAAIQVAAVGYDLRGHGRSGGPRGHVERWQDFQHDLEMVLKATRARFPGLPVFLFGHSLGSLIVLAQVLGGNSAAKGIILCGTAVDPVGIARPHLVAIARIFSRVWPKFALPVHHGGSRSLSRDPAMQQQFRSDPLILRYVTARFGVEGLSMVATLKPQAQRLELPALFLHGGEDPLNSLTGARQFFQQVRSADKRMIVYPGSYHEPQNDLDAERLFSDVCAWIQDRC
jgi:alpha-beta hydrolase superfamily lysophospholipase